MAASHGDTSRVDSTLANEISAELVAEFPDIAAGRVFAVVVRAMADLRRIAVTAEVAAAADDYRRVVLELARHQLNRG